MTPLDRLRDALSVPPHLKRFYHDFRGRQFRILDIGCGHHSPAKVKRYFPYCEYHGLDLEMVELDENDRRLMTRFYKANLETDTLDAVPDNYFDVIVMSHVIEHLHHGVEALNRLARKLRTGGLFYIEYPGWRSLGVPSAKAGFLHFSDDPTHVRLYTLQEVVNILLANRFTILKAGTRRDRMRLLFTPLLLMRGLLHGNLWSGRPWDAFGIAEYVYARAPVRPDEASD